MILCFVLLFLLSISSSTAQDSQDISELVKLYNNIGRCETPHHEAGLCIDIKQCSSLLSIILKFSISPRETEFLRSSFCGYHQNMTMVCCPIKSLKTLWATTTVKPLASQDEPPSRRQPENPPTRPPLIHTITKEPPISSITVSGIIPYNGQAYNSLPQPGVCGISSFNDRIIGGNVSNIDEYPWMAILVYKKSDNTTALNCAGSLINERYVLTAAHCISDVPERWSLDAVRLGEYDISTEIDCVSDVGETICSDRAIDISIEKIIAHTGFTGNRKELHDDIGLIRLSKPATFTDWVQPICLPISDKIRNSNFENQTMQIAGWGRTELSSKSTVRLKASIPVIGGKECKEAYNRNAIELLDTQICAGGKSIDSCAGDSGGPLMSVAFDKQPYFFLAGIISFGPTPCGISGKPGVYTRVGAYIDWIESNMEP